MNADWITSPSARRVLQHDADPRPAWLWSQDGQKLIWQNAAAALFMAKIKKSGLKLAAPAIPIKGQVSRNIRLGSTGRTSLARIQFLLGEKPISSTCATTPLLWEGERPVLLIVDVDPIEPEMLAAAALRENDDAEAVEPAATEQPVDAPDPIAAIIETDEHAYERELESWRAADQEQAYEPANGGDQDTFVATAETIGETAPEDIGTDDSWSDEADNEPEVAASEAAPEVEPEANEPATRGASRLSSLVDRLAADEHLYTPLTDADDAVLASREVEPEEAAPNLFTITGRGFTPIAATEPEQTDAEADLGDLERLDEAFKPENEVPEELEPEVAAPNAAELEAVQAALAALGPTPVSDSDTVERVSRYNFDELSRILNDRVGETAPQPSNLVCPRLRRRPERWSTWAGKRWC